MHKYITIVLPCLLPFLLLIMPAGCSQSETTTPITEDARYLPPSKQRLVPVSEFLKTNKGVIAFASQGLSSYSSYLKERLGVLPSSLEESKLEYPNPPTIEIDPSFLPDTSEKHLRVVSTRLTTLGAYIEKVIFHPRHISVYVVPKMETFHDIEVDLNLYKNGQHVPVYFIIRDRFNEFFIEKVPN